MAFFVLLKNVLKLNRQLGAIEQSVSIATETSENLFQLIVRGGVLSCLCSVAWWGPLGSNS